MEISQRKQWGDCEQVGKEVAESIELLYNSWGRHIAFLLRKTSRVGKGVGDGTAIVNIAAPLPVLDCEVAEIIRIGFVVAHGGSDRFVITLIVQP